jgi:hypothetical protein
MKKWHMLTLLVALTLICAVPVHAQVWYMDVGLEVVDLGQDLSDVSMGFGLALDFGLDFSNGFALNIGIGSSAHQEDGFDTTYNRFSIGPRVTFDAGSVRPYLEAGIMSHNVTWDFLFYDIDGTGLYIGAGALWPMVSGGSVGGYVKYSSWDGEDSFGNFGDVSTTVIGVSYIFGY